MTTALIALPILYALSIGPVVYAIIQYGGAPQPKIATAIDVFYKPLELLHDHTPLKEPLDRYVEWWLRIARKP